MDRHSSSKRHSKKETQDTYKNIILKTIKNKKIGELLNEKPEFLELSHHICRKQMINLPEKDAYKICDCLNEKNKDLTVQDLEEAVEKKEETPGSSCVLLYDKAARKSKGKLAKKLKSKSKSMSSIKSNSTRLIKSRKYRKSKNKTKSTSRN